MNEVECEVLNNYNYECPAHINIVEQDVVVQQMIVNGEIHNQTAKSLVLACDNCGRVLYEFPVGINRLDVLRLLKEKQSDFSKVFNYCSGCGKKLDFNDFDFVECTFEEVVKEAI